MRNSCRYRRLAGLRTGLCGVLMVAIAGCAPTFRNHGYIPPADELALIEVGQDTRASVEEKVGVPVSSGVLGDSGYYYVRMRTRTLGPLAPREIDRQVVAISFSSAGRGRECRTLWAGARAGGAAVPARDRFHGQRHILPPSDPGQHWSVQPCGLWRLTRWWTRRMR